MGFFVEVPLTQGKVALVDSEDFARVMQHKWYAAKDGKTEGLFYAKSRMGEYSAVSMHRFILGLTKNDSDVDHINGNGLDNRKRNLRLVTKSENSRNRDSVKNARGYTIDGKGFRNKPYKVQKNGKHVGRYATAEEAQEAYRNA